MPSFVRICAVCDDTGRIVLKDARHGEGGSHEEWIPCVCQDSYAIEKQRIEAKAGEGTMSEMLRAVQS